MDINFSANEINSPDKTREWEFRQLPECPSGLTFRGRYSHVDKRLIELCGINQLQKGSIVRVLDVGCGILNFGSPTMHDLWDALIEAGIHPEMVGVDQTIPKDLVPTYSKITYQPHLPVCGEFDVVRMLRVWEHMSQNAYDELRTKALGLLRDGGCFIATQAIGRWKLDSAGYDLRRVGPAVKIAQKREGKLVAVDLLPDTILPWNSCFMGDKRVLADYALYRKRVSKGEEDIAIIYDERNLESVISYLNCYSPEVLEEDSEDAQCDRGLLRGDSLSKGSLEQVKIAGQETAKYFHS